jgi:hypothetical protein
MALGASTVAVAGATASPAGAAATTDPLGPVLAEVESLAGDVIYTLTQLPQCLENPRNPYCIVV